MNETNRDFELYILGEVNKILENHKQKLGNDYAEQVKNIQNYVKDALAPVLRHAIEVDEKTHQRALAAEETSKARFEESEKQRTLEVRTQNACILFASGKLNHADCVSIVVDFERAFKGKK